MEPVCEAGRRSFSAQQRSGSQQAIEAVVSRPCKTSTRLMRSKRQLGRRFCALDEPEQNLQGRLPKQSLVKFWLEHPRAEQPLRSWLAAVGVAKWTVPRDIKYIGTHQE